MSQGHVHASVPARPTRGALLHPDVVRQQVGHVRVQLVEVHQGVVNEPEGVIVAVQDPLVAVWGCRDVGQEGGQGSPEGGRE